MSLDHRLSGKEAFYGQSKRHCLVCGVSAECAIVRMGSPMARYGQYDGRQLGLILHDLKAGAALTPDRFARFWP
jgi:hypothetical protein